MTADNFKEWISGYLELSTTLSDREIKIKSAVSRLSALDLCYWISGSFECGGYELTKAELVMKDHLALVFNKVTPNRTDKTSPEYFHKIIEDFNKNHKNDESTESIFDRPYTPTITIC